MDKLSNNKADLKSQYEIVVIGSGYGGGIAASRLSRAGRQVCLLEKGKEIQPGEYPNNMVDLLKEVQSDLEIKHVGKRNSLFDFRQNKDINVVAGCGLGGTSLINAGICMRPEPSIFDNSAWPEPLKNSSTLEKYFALAESMLKPMVYPQSEPKPQKLIEFKKATQNMAGEYILAPVLVNYDVLPNNKNHIGIEQHPCIHCGDCITGCNYSAKNTVLMNYLPDAKNHGTEIYTEITVRSIMRNESQWLISITDTHDKQLTQKQISADIVVLSAGTLGSNEILLRSKEKGLSLSTKLGKRFSGNGDMVSFAYNSDFKINGVGLGENSTQRQSLIGATANSVIDFRRTKNTKDMVVIDAVIPGAFSSILPASLYVLSKFLGRNAGRGFRDKLREFWRVIVSKFRGAYHGAVNHTLFLLTVSEDDAQGEMYLKDDRLRISWPGVGEQAPIKEASECMAQVARNMGATFIPNPIWNELTNHDLLTGHPLGGCTMADTSVQGVVNHKGQVFTGADLTSIHKGLYVMDGSVVASSLGINPLLTISALAERNVALLAEDNGWEINYSF
jgi:cholesterol oxidase